MVGSSLHPVILSPLPPYSPIPTPPKIAPLPSPRSMLYWGHILEVSLHHTENGGLTGKQVNSDLKGLGRLFDLCF